MSSCCCLKDYLKPYQYVWKGRLWKYIFVVICMEWIWYSTPFGTRKKLNYVCCWWSLYVWCSVFIYILVILQHHPCYMLGPKDASVLCPLLICNIHYPSAVFYALKIPFCNMLYPNNALMLMLRPNDTLVCFSKNWHFGSPQEERACVSVEPWHWTSCHTPGTAKILPVCWLIYQQYYALIDDLYYYLVM